MPPAAFPMRQNSSVICGDIYFTHPRPLATCLRLSKRRRRSKRSSTRNADRPAEMRSKASFDATSVTLVNKDLSFPPVVIEDPILTPGELSCYQFVLGATKRMKGMGYPESACGGSHTTCIR